MTEKNSYQKPSSRKRKPEVDISTMVYGKVPPQAKEIEEAVLGAIMLEKDAFYQVADILKPECFYLESHQRVFRAMQSLSQKSQPIDLLTVVEELRSKEELEITGGPYFVTRLTNSVVSSANIEGHSRIILQKFLQREIIRICGESISAAFDDGSDPFELLDQHEKSFTDITVGNLQQSYTGLDVELVKGVQRIEELRKKKEHVTGVPTGFAELDRVTQGWQPTDLIILAARPSVGKTALALNFARNAAKHPDKKVAVGFLSLEMSKAQLVERLMAAESGIHLSKIKNGWLDENEMKILYQQGIQSLATAGIFIDDTAGLNIHSVRSKARQMKRREKIGLLLIDYLQLMSGTDDRSNREQEISRISRSLKTLAKELGIPIIALSQLSRETEKRKGADKMPQLSDLRESGAIEQDADTVMFIYRPEYYDINSNEIGETTRGETNIRIAKHRHGALDTIKLRAELSIQKFHNWEGELPAELPKGNWKPIRDDKGNQLDFDSE